MCSLNDIRANLAALRAGEAHIWLNDSASALPALEQCRAVLSDDERLRAEKIQAVGAREEFVLAHALLRAALSQYYSVKPGAWQFGREPQDKPFIRAPADAPPLRFNLTHTRGLAACVIALDAAVGVDAERIEPHADLLEVARQFFRPVEASEVQALAGEKQLERFYELWTLKEACGKARGQGLKTVFDQPAANLNFVQQRASPDHVLAAVVSGKPDSQFTFRLRVVKWRVAGNNSFLEVSEADQILPSEKWPCASR